MRPSWHVQPLGVLQLAASSGRTITLTAPLPATQKHAFVQHRGHWQPSPMCRAPLRPVNACKSRHPRWFKGLWITEQIRRSRAWEVQQLQRAALLSRRGTDMWTACSMCITRAGHITLSTALGQTCLYVTTTYRAPRCSPVTGNHHTCCSCPVCARISGRFEIHVDSCCNQTRLLYASTPIHSSIISCFEQTRARCEW